MFTEPNEPTNFLRPNLSYNRAAIRQEAQRLAERGAHLDMAPAAWGRIAWNKARAERNRAILFWLALRAALAMACGADPQEAVLIAVAVRVDA